MTRQSPWEKKLEDSDTDTAILSPSPDAEEDEHTPPHRKVSSRAHKKVEIQLPTRSSSLIDPTRIYPSKAAQLSVWCALSALTLIFFSVAGAHYRLLSPFVGFRLFAASMLLGGLFAFIFGFGGLLSTAKGEGRPGRGQARFGLLVGAGLLGSLATLLAGQDSRLPIHDITTDLEDPPTFVQLAERPANQGRDLSYPHGAEDSRDLQRENFPDLEPIELGLPLPDAFVEAEAVALDLGWTVIHSNLGQGLLEAEAESGLFRFVDDVVVRLRPTVQGGTRLDLRSTSRVGVSDLGANAARIRSFEAALRSRLANGPD